VIHRPDPISLIFGSGFIALAVLVIAGRIGALGDTRWVWPAVLVAVGIFMLASLLGGRRHHEPPASGPE
jgi:hypothetical protein